MKITSILFFMMFLVFAYMQLNDPDPFQWVSIYLVAAFISIMNYFGRIRKYMLFAFFLVFLVGAILLWPPKYEGLEGKMMKEKPGIELARESLGLGVAALACGVFFLGRKPKNKVIR